MLALCMEQKYGIDVPATAVAGMGIVIAPDENVPVSKDTPLTELNTKESKLASLVNECEVMSLFRTVTVDPGVTRS